MQFNRVASVVFDDVDRPGFGFEISGLRISFDIQKTADKTPNTCKLVIYNLSEATRAKIKKDQKIILKAGYSDGAKPKVIFIGNISVYNHAKKHPEIVTTIDADDGLKGQVESRVTLSHGPGAKAATILKQIVKTLPFSDELNKISLPDVEYPEGFAFTGPSRFALEKVLKKMGMEWSVQNDLLKVITQGGTDSSTAVVLKASTGLIGSPERLTSETRKAKGKDQTVKPGWKFESLINPEINPNGRVSVTSEQIKENTIFKVISVQHSGDTHGDNWNSTIEAIE